MQQHLGENMVEVTHWLSQNKLNQEPSCCHPWQLPQCVNTSVRSCFRETVMSACLEMCLDSECISLNLLALFKALCLNIHADCLEKLAFLLPYFYRAHPIWKGLCVCVCVLLFPSFTPDGEEESLLTPEWEVCWWWSLCYHHYRLSGKQGVKLGY